jgi:hypothetical protein
MQAGTGNWPEKHQRISIGEDAHSLQPFLNQVILWLPIKISGRCLCMSEKK